MKPVAFAVRDSAVRAAYVNGPDLALLPQAQRRMKRIPFEQVEFVVS
jgi:hypothetical protein